MADILMRSAGQTDFSAVVALNAAEVRRTSPMDVQRLRQLDGIASYHKVASVGVEVAAFLVGMRDGCGCANENFEWFASRYPAFL